MAEEKTKYIRKKCEHGKYSFQCKDCRGISLCEHGKRKIYCKTCDGRGLCEHNRVKYQCKMCHGGNICDHNKRRSRCVTCKGGSICEHGTLRSRCVTCDGSEMCEHQRRREICVVCDGSQTCQHQLRKSRCLKCNGSEVCIHGNNKYICVTCGGKNICDHDKIRDQCVKCKGNLVCEHGKRKSICKECDGSYMCSHEKQKNQCITCTPSSGCQHCHMISVVGSKWNPYCFRCYCVLNPDAVIPRKYKLKEHHVVDKLKENFQEKFTMRFDKIVEGGCSRRRPDVAIDFGSHCLMIEIDENKHTNYSCEEKRMVELYEDVGFRKIVFLRFNPDRYKDGSAVYPSPFRYTRAGILHLEETEFNRRMDQLMERIRAHRVEPIDQITVEYLFYGA
jgi:hypothetical protein